MKLKSINVLSDDLILYKNIFSEIDYYFAKKIVELNSCSELDDVLFILSLMLSYCVSSERNICLDLNSELLNMRIKELLDIENAYDINIDIPVMPDNLAEILEECNVVGRPGEYQPIIMNGGRLYLQKYWYYEQKIAQRIGQFSSQKKFSFDLKLLTDGLNRIFPISSVRKNSKDWQRVAAFGAVVNPFCIITGGPGTGKTTVVATVLLLLQENALSTSKKPLKIKLCAPTGKAAARMSEAVSFEKQKMMCCDDVLKSIPEESSTIHRLLGARYLSPNFKHDSTNKLDIDVLVVDEASMVPMILMSRLLDAVSDQTKVILLGDRNQLASVEAGAVFADICDVAAGKSDIQDTFSEQFALMYSQTLRNPGKNKLKTVINPPILTDSVVELTDSYRFDPERGIGQLKDAVNAGKVDESFEIINNDSTGEIYCKDIAADPKTLRADLLFYVSNLTLGDLNTSFLSYLEVKDIDRAFEIFNSFRILCAHRVGLWGTDEVNRHMTDIIKKKKMISPNVKYFKGLPILIKSNYPALNLFNGDIGICWDSPLSTGSISVFFPDIGNPGKYRSLLPAQLPEHETVFAMTVHKSQGSGFESVLLLLSGRDESPVLTRELVYTGITRAKKCITVWTSDKAFRNAVSKKTTRYSGICDAVKSYFI